MLPGKAKLAAVMFAANRIDIDSIELLLREPLNMTGYRIESRVVTWPLNLESGVVIDMQTLSGNEIPQQDWTSYYEFESETNSPPGKILQVSRNNSNAIPPTQLSGVDAGSVDFANRIFYSIELRLVAPDGETVHSRHFLPDDDYVNEDLSVLRRADGTGLFLVKPGSGSNLNPFPLSQYRLKLTYHRNNRTRIATSQIWTQAGNDADEIITLDIPLQTQ